MLKLNSKSYKIIGISGVIIVIGVIIGFLIVKASPDSVTDTFTDETKISSKTNLTVSGGQVKLAIWTLNETTCNALTGWHWYTTNTRSACWSKTLADFVSWNKSVNGLDDCASDNCTASSGAYTCKSGYTLQQRMEAATKTTGDGAEWWKIVESVAGTSITSAHDGSAGWSYISALAITDCIDGVHDLGAGTGSGTQIVGASFSDRNITLRAWAGATGGKSALPYLATDAGNTQATNDYWDACQQNSRNDLPLGCADALFHKNRKVCGVAENHNMAWLAVCGESGGGGDWETESRCIGGYSGCSGINGRGTSWTSEDACLRAVVRP